MNAHVKIIKHAQYVAGESINLIKSKYNNSFAYTYAVCRLSDNAHASEFDKTTHVNGTSASLQLQCKQLFTLLQMVVDSTTEAQFTN